MKDPETPEEKAEAHRLISQDITYVMLQIDRALARRDTHVRIRVGALVTVIDVIRLSTQVAKEQHRQTGQGFWHSLKELLRRY